MNTVHLGILGAFHRQVTATPNRPAVVDGNGTTMTYSDLRDHSVAIATTLQKQGVKQGSIVPVIAGRTCGAIAAELAVLQAGAAIMPIGADLPPKALERQLELADSCVCVVADVMVPVPNVMVIDVQTIPVGDAGGIDPPTISPDDLAYVISTSGSTGVPKGAKNTHRALAHLVDAIQHTILSDYGNGLRTALVAPWTFDPWVQQVFPALVRGDTIYIADDQTRRDGRLLARFFHEHQIEISDGTPSHLHLLANTSPTILGNLPVRHFIIGGERMQSTDVSLFYKRIPTVNPKITNIYGVAECAVDSLCFTFDRTTLPTRADVPVGRPLGQTTVAILDDNNTEARKGQSGELCIGGPGVGAGYLGDTELSARKFVVRNNKLIYRTGDMARQLPDGNIEILGRLDHQVKIAGKRVELGQIESAMRTYQPLRIDELNSSRLSIADTQCKRCILTSAQPGISFDTDGICNFCRDHERWQSALNSYWKTADDFTRLAAGIRASNRGPYDCLLLYSGGKDSTYVLHRLHQTGLRVHTWTFDNGFISDEALANIERTTCALGIPHVTERTTRMNDIFANSLKADQTVCGGCFRALTTLSTRFAAKHGIPLVVTGLSRGQIVQTKIAPLLEEGIFDSVQIERRLVYHRKMYHQRLDSIHDLLDMPIDDSTIDNIRFVDYFRYEMASDTQIVEYLKARDARWRRPGNTGFCSTNCRINDAGIAVHLTVRGYHNYASPLSWDVRFGLMSREKALSKVRGHVDDRAVGTMLRSIGYQPQVTGATVVKVSDVLVGFITAEQKIDQHDLRTHLERLLPRYAIPSRLHQIDVIPLTPNGKIDTFALAQMDVELLRNRTVAKVENPIEQALVELWDQVLGYPPTDTKADFIDAGGTSIKASELVLLIEERFGLDELPQALVFTHPTIHGLAQEITARLQSTTSLPEGMVLMKRSSL